MNGIIAMESRMQRKLHVRFGGGNRADSRSSTTPTQLDETMGPNEAACPASILDLLGPPRNEYAANWRRACRARLALTTRPKPNEGDKIIFQTPITFADGYEAQRFTVKRHGRQLALRGENGGLYRVRRFMEQRWSCIPATNVFGARDKR